MQFVFWPQMWFDTAENFGRYVSFHVGHVHYPQEYFGDLLNVPPFPVSYPFVMTLLTVPVPVQVTEPGPVPSHVLRQSPEARAWPAWGAGPRWAGAANAAGANAKTRSRVQEQEQVFIG